MIKRRFASSLALALVLLPIGWAEASALPSALDPSFGGDGTVVTEFRNVRPFVVDMVAAPRGGAYVVGNAGDRFYGGRLFVLRYDRRGRLVRGFGRRGVAIVALPQGRFKAAGAVVQPDGRVVVVGTLPSPTRRELALVRFERDGQIDSSFDQDGVQIADLGGAFHEAVDVVLQTDGALVAAGSGVGPVAPGSELVARQLAVARFRSDGSPDATFGHAGVVRLPVKSDLSFFEGEALALMSDGSILLAGNAGMVGREGHPVAASIPPDGSLEPGWNSDRLLVYGGAETPWLSNVTIDRRSGRAYLVGFTGVDFGPTKFWLAALKPDLEVDREFGVADPEFGVAGSSLASFPKAETAYATSVALDASGRVLLAGTAHRGARDPVSAFAFARFLPSGQLDRRFGRRGRVQTGLGRGWNVATCLLIQRGGRLLAAGTSAGPDFLAAGKAIALTRLRGR